MLVNSVKLFITGAALIYLNVAPSFAETSLPLPSLQSKETLQPATKNIHLELDLTKRRVFVFEDAKEIHSYPVAIGKPGWETPAGTFKVRRLLKDPIWRSFYDDQVIPAGSPDNPLGKFWIEFWTDGKDVIGFHATPYPDTVGKEISHGCVRMYEKDIEEMFKLVSVDTLVIVKRSDIN